MATLPLVVIVGATGNIGEPLTQFLSKGGKHRVRAIGRDTKKKFAETLGRLPNVELADVNDWKNAGELDAAVKGGDYLVIIKPFIQEMVQFTKNWADAAKSSGTVKHVLLVSAVGADVAAKKYKVAAEQRASEEAVEATGLAYTHLRPAFFHSNLLNYVSTIKGQNALFLPWGTHRFVGIDTSDIAAAFYFILKNPSAHVNKGYTLNVRDKWNGHEIAAFFSKALGREIKYIEIDEATFINNIKPHVPEWLLNHLVELHQIVRNGDAEYEANDLKELTGRDGVSLLQWIYENKEAF